MVILHKQGKLMQGFEATRRNTSADESVHIYKAVIQIVASKDFVKSLTSIYYE